MDWIYYILLATVGVFGVAMNIVGLPGNWILVLMLAGYAYLTGWGVYVGPWGLGAVVVLGLLGELGEFVAGGAGAKKAGGSKRGVIGAIVGGFLGAIFLSIIPIPIISQIVGACAGAFIGAFVVEYLIEPDAVRSTNIGIGAAKGRLWGIAIKLTFGLAMLLATLVTAFPVGRATPVAAESVTTPDRTPLDFQPATQPVTQPAELPLER